MLAVALLAKMSVANSAERSGYVRPLSRPGSAAGGANQLVKKCPDPPVIDAFFRELAHKQSSFLMMAASGPVVSGWVPGCAHPLFGWRRP